jgi:hypothetical protein
LRKNLQNATKEEEEEEKKKDDKEDDENDDEEDEQEEEEEEEEDEAEAEAEEAKQTKRASRPTKGIFFLHQPNPPITKSFIKIQNLTTLFSLHTHFKIQNQLTTFYCLSF